MNFTINPMLGVMFDRDVVVHESPNGDKTYIVIVEDHAPKAEFTVSCQDALTKGFDLNESPSVIADAWDFKNGPSRKCSTKLSAGTPMSRLTVMPLSGNRIQLSDHAIVVMVGRREALERACLIPAPKVPEKKFYIDLDQIRTYLSIGNMPGGSARIPSRSVHEGW